MLDEEEMLGVAIRIEDANTKDYRVIKAAFPSTHIGLLNTIPEEDLKGKISMMGFYSDKVEFTSRQSLFLKYKNH